MSDTNNITVSDIFSDDVVRKIQSDATRLKNKAGA